jgi:hypothetical protein
MAVEFWLDKFTELINIDNFSFLYDKPEQKKIKLLNLLAVFSIIFGLMYYRKTKNKSYIGVIVLVLSLTVLLRSRKTQSSFKSNFGEVLSNSYDTGVYLVRAVNGKNTSGLNNTLYVNNALNFNPGDIIALSNGTTIQESNVVTGIQYTVEDNTPVLVLLNPIKNNYSKYTTKILKVSDTSPNIVTPTDPNISIQNSQGSNPLAPTDPMSMAVENYPPFKLPNMDRNDWNLELSTIVPGEQNMYQYQGQPYGNLKCRESTLNNPMGTINVTEYDQPPTMYGTCNIGEDNNNYKMTSNQEATVSQRVDDLLFHKGNSQTQFSPMPVDTLPSDQEAFAHWCYRNPTNLVNAKYASIFVNEPEKFKLVSKLARATGTENGGGGGR